MIFTPDERRAILTVGGLILLGLGVRLFTNPILPPPGGGDSVLVAVARSADSIKVTLPPPPGLLESGRIRINEAVPVDLERLPGVGPVMARRIVEERRKGGEFQNARDLERVPGIGPKRAARLSELITFERESPGDHAACMPSRQSATPDSGRQGNPDRED